MFALSFLGTLRCLAIPLGRVEDKDCATLCVPLPRSLSVGRGAGGLPAERGA